MSQAPGAKGNGGLDGLAKAGASKGAPAKGAP